MVLLFAMVINIERKENLQNFTDYRYVSRYYSQPSESDNEFETAEPKSVVRGRRPKNAAAGETTMVSLA